MAENKDKLPQLIQEEFTKKKEVSKEEQLKRLLREEDVLMEQEIINNEVRFGVEEGSVCL